ncbi:MAG TPA: anti-sigma factor [Gemmataceae bacterium]|jgi:anti-sigma factor RsiW|nr:anti-sigma factor [Gemmataceae bacterium]
MNLCALFDDYVAHDLAAPEQARFEAHLAECPACRHKVDAERYLDSLLAEATSGPVPGNLSERVRRRLAAARQRRLAAGLALLAACALVSVLAGHWLSSRQPGDSVPEGQAHLEQPAPEVLPSPASAGVRVTFSDPARVLAVPVASDSPHVTVIQVYTALREPVGAAQSQDNSNPVRSDP